MKNQIVAVHVDNTELDVVAGAAMLHEQLVDEKVLPLNATMVLAVRTFAPNDSCSSTITGSTHDGSEPQRDAGMTLEAPLKKNAALPVMLGARYDQTDYAIERFDDIDINTSTILLHRSEQTIINDRINEFVRPLS